MIDPLLTAIGSVRSSLIALARYCAGSGGFAPWTPRRAPDPMTRIAAGAPLLTQHPMSGNQP